MTSVKESLFIIFIMSFVTYSTRSFVDISSTSLSTLAFFLTENPPQWVDYDPKRGASDKVLTFHCDSLYDRALLQELGV